MEGKGIFRGGGRMDRVWEEKTFEKGRLNGKKLKCWPGNGGGLLMWDYHLIFIREYTMSWVTSQART